MPKMTKKPVISQKLSVIGKKGQQLKMADMGKNQFGIFRAFQISFFRDEVLGLEVV
jgi:hypothetical protein